MPTRTSKRKVQFFEVCDEDGERIGQVLPWDEVLGAVGRQTVSERRHVLQGIPHWGQAYVHDDRENLVVARLRAEGVSTFDIEQDQIIDQASQAAVPYVELSIVSILPSTNKFGLVRGSNASSHAVTIGDWINAHELFGRSITIVPLISRRTMQKIANAREVKLLDVSYNQELSAATAVADSGGLSSAVNALVGDHGPAEIEIVIRQKGRTTDQDTQLRRTLANTMRAVASRPFSKAVADIVTTDFDGRPMLDRINFLNDILARRMTVSVTDEEGNPVRIPSAIAAISRAADVLREDLEA